jgi:hypothetical protein
LQTILAVDIFSASPLKREREKEVAASAVAACFFFGGM